jgi:hypothetical protein
LLRKLVQLFGLLVMAGLVLLGLMIYAEEPLPQSVIDFEAATGLTKRGRLIGDGYALVHSEGIFRGGFGRYDPIRDEYIWGLGGHIDYLPDNTIIRVEKYIRGRVYSCFNGMSVMFGTIQFLIPITANEIADKHDLAENHAHDTCRIILVKKDREQDVSQKK